MPIVTRDQWEEFVQTFPQAHIMQTAGWGELKESPSWNHIHVVNDNNGAQILIRTIVMNYTMAYIPKGPLGQDWSSLWPEIDAVCKAKNVVFLKVEPDVYEEDRLDLQRQGFKASKQNIQPRRTIVIDIRKDEKDILAAMKQKTRYNIRLAEKQGVVVKPSTDLHVFHNLLRVTAERDEFGVHTLEYYQKVYQLFNSIGQGELLIAEYQGEPLAGLIWRIQ
jgi:peptidoglycan pentaglycine glycine transferase (the first glycine)